MNSRWLLLGIAFTASARAQTEHGGAPNASASTESSARRDDYFDLAPQLAKIRESLKSKQPDAWRKLSEACRQSDPTPDVPKLVAQTLAQSLSKKPSSERALRGLSEKSFLEALMVAASDTVGAPVPPCRESPRAGEFSPCLRAHMAASIEVGENLRTKYNAEGGDRIYSRLNFPMAWSSGARLACFLTGKTGEVADRHALLAFRDVHQRGYRGVGAQARGYVNQTAVTSALQKWIMPGARVELPAVLNAQGELAAPTQSYDFKSGSPWSFLGFNSP